MSVSSQASEASISEEETAYSSAAGSGAATPIPTPKPKSIDPTPTKSLKYLQHEGLTTSPTERSPLLPRRTTSTERNGHARGVEEGTEEEWTWWDEFKTLTSYVLPVYGYVLRCAPSFVSSSRFAKTGPTY